MTSMRGHATSPRIKLAGAAIVVPGRAGETLRYAAAELARFLFLLGGRRCPIVAALPARGPAVILDRRLAASLGATATPEELGEQGYQLLSLRQGARTHLAIVSTSDVGTLYGVYGLLEELGMGFYAGGETYPDGHTAPALSSGLDRVRKPVFSARGNMLHYNFLCGPTDWGVDDYRFYFDQLARMRCNTLLMHWYDGEPGAAFEDRGEYVTGGRTPNSLSKPWGALASLRTSQFSFGSGRFFDAEIFSSPAGSALPDSLTEIKESERMWREATRYARVAGIRVAAGFEEPRGDPTDRATVRRFKMRIRQFVARNPHISHFALWQHESGACFGTSAPPAGTGAARLLKRHRGTFAHLGTDRRVWEAIRFGEFARIADELLEKEAPHLRMVVVGWGGDRWMRFGELCLGYDKLLPPDVVFTCHDNIDASFGPNVTMQWGELPPYRERWAMPWVEGDIDECWVRQPHVESLGSLAPDALQKGAQGLLTLQWRTRGVEEETGYAARFAWNPSLTPNDFYRDLAGHSFGRKRATELGHTLGDLQRMGARWTGVRGCGECSTMQWTGWSPHLPFDLDASAVPFLLPMAAEAADALARVPPDDIGLGGAYHERDTDAPRAVETDPKRPGVRELRRAASRLRSLRGVHDEQRLRAGLQEIEEAVWAVRPSLIALGMDSPQYQALDRFLIAIHHLQRNAGASRKLPKLRGVRSHLAAVRRDMVDHGELDRLERLDYLDATLRFAIHFDSAAMLLAAGELVETAIAKAEREKARGRTASAARVAAQAYAKLVEAGMSEAVDALTGKLTTRCDFGVLATVNVKPLPLYWAAVERLEALLPAVPPREVIARAREGATWVSWECAARADHLNLHRRAGSRGKWRRINREPLAADCCMFIDRTPANSSAEYAVTATATGGWESPLSHPGRVGAGATHVGPRIVACKPPGRANAREPLEVRVVIVSDHDLSETVVHYRNAGDRRWSTAPMIQRYRQAYGADLPAADLGEGLIEWYVRAVDSAGNCSAWPVPAASGRYWTTVIM